MSILNSNKPVAHLGRSSFDLSSTHAFSMRPAVLRPVIVQDTVPDSAFRINCSDLVRTSSLQTAAFLRGKHELDFFFVPYNLVYSFFNDIVLERGDIKSPIVRNISPEDSSIPSVSLPHLYWNALVPYLFERYMRYMVAANGGDFPETFFTDWLASFLGESFPTQQHFMNMCLYNSWEASIQRYDINTYSFIGYDALALLDTLGYGNFGAIVVRAYDEYLKDKTVLQSAVWPELINVSLELIQVYFQLSAFDPSSASDSSLKRVSPLRLFAYQKIFYDRYRDEVFDNDPNYSFSVSMDFDFADLNWDPLATGAYTNFPLNTFLRPRVRMVKKDLVSGLYPSAQFGNKPQMNDFREMDDLKLPYSNPPEQPQSIETSATNVRYVLAMQKYRETLLRAGSRSKDVLRAMFGVESRYIDDTYVRYLGSFSGMLELNKVSATAEGGSYSVGDLAGNVFSSIQGDTIEFTCNDYGVIVGVMSFFPELLHNNYGVSPHVLKTKPLQFFKAQFEDLGLQPVSSSIISLINCNQVGDINTHELTLGYSARYNEYKQNLDFSHDQFGTSSFELNLRDFGLIVKSVDGYNSNYVVTRHLPADINWSSLRNYLLPDCMDSLFSSVDTGDITNYHFDVILDCQINAVLPMSTLGLPY